MKATATDTETQPTYSCLCCGAHGSMTTHCGKPTTANRGLS